MKQFQALAQGSSFFFGHITPALNSLEKPLMLGKVEGERRGQPAAKGKDSVIMAVVAPLGD